MIKSNTYYPIEVLLKSRAVLESNIKGVPGMFINPDAVIRYQRQIREVDRAIEYLELMEATKKKRREMAVLK
ncbi:MAG: hypothetical protein JWO03_957 [Bacteroidetes bacterium]|nr:hypothetical protein [Bacteroidota bacterium]